MKNLKVQEKADFNFDKYPTVWFLKSKTKVRVVISYLLQKTSEWIFNCPRQRKLKLFFLKGELSLTLAGGVATPSDFKVREHFAQRFFSVYITEAVGRYNEKKMG